MIGGVNFQPGNAGDQQRRATGGSPDGIQEAIKVLSLRLPKVVGARAVSPQALLQSPGSGGNPRVDSIVQSVLSRMFPGQGGPQPSAPMLPSGGGQTSGTMPTGTPSPFSGPVKGQTSDAPGPNHFWDLFPKMPNIVIGPGPGQTGTDADLSGGGGQPNGMIAPLPNHAPPSSPPPDLRQYLDWLPQPDMSNPLF